VLAEQYIRGREIDCGVLGDISLPPIEIIPNGTFYDYQNKYQAGAAREICPAEIDASAAREIGDMALAVHQMLGLKAYSRSDFLLDGDGKVWFLEINTLPGMTPTSLLPQEAAAVGISFDALCARIMELSLEAHRV